MAGVVDDGSRAVEGYGRAEATTVQVVCFLDETRGVDVTPVGWGPVVARRCGVNLWPGRCRVDQPLPRGGGGRVMSLGWDEPDWSREGSSLASPLNDGERLPLATRYSGRFARETVCASHLFKLSTCACKSLCLSDH